MKIRFQYIYIAVILLSILLLAGCSNSPEGTEPSVTPELNGSSSTKGENNIPVLYGLWMKAEDSNKGTGREMLTITEKSVYLVETSGTKDNSAIRETFFEISDVDWVNSVITMSAKWVRINGNFGGFDYPLRYMKVSVDGDTLYFSMGDEGQGIPTEAVNGPWLRQ